MQLWFYVLSLCRVQKVPTLWCGRSLSTTWLNPQKITITRIIAHENVARPLKFTKLRKEDSEFMLIPIFMCYISTNAV